MPNTLAQPATLLSEEPAAAIPTDAPEILTATIEQPEDQPKDQPEPAAAKRVITDPQEALAISFCEQKLWLKAGQIYAKLARIRPDDIEIVRGQLLCSQMLNHKGLAKMIMDVALAIHPEWEGTLVLPPAPPPPPAPAGPSRPLQKTTRRRSCAQIEGGLVILPDELRVCCYWNKRGGQPLIAKYKDGPFPLDTILAKRTEIKEALQHGTYEACEGCVFLEEKEWPDHPTHHFTNLDVVTSTACQLRCYYCYTVKEPERVKVSAYDPFLLFQQFMAKDWISPEAHVIWSGGEPTTSKRFEETMPLLMFGKLYHRIQSHCERVSPAVLEALRQNRAEVICSLDAGTRETYALVKGHDWFDKVVATCARYAANGGNLRLKYICLKENLQRPDLDGFMAVARQLKARSLLFDYNISFHNQPGEEVLEALGYLVWQAQSSNIPFEFFASIMASAPELKYAERILQIADGHRERAQAAEAELSLAGVS